MDGRGLVLIVDDSEDIADACEFVLGRAGYEVVIAADGEVGLERACELRPVLIVLDMMMPNTDGLEFLERLPRLCVPAPPVIAYSGFHQLAPLALARGAAAFLPKPFDLVTLTELAHTVLTASSPAAAVNERAAAYSQSARAHADEEREAFWIDTRSDDPWLRRDLRRLTAWAAGYFGAERAFVTALHHDRLHVLAEHGADADFPEGCAMDPAVNFCPDVIRAATPLVLADTQAAPGFAGHPAAEMVRFYAGAPLLLGDGLAVGTFCLEHRRPTRFGAEDMGLLDHFARLIGRMFEHLRSRRLPVPIFDGDLLLAEEHLTLIAAAELRRAERDGSAVELALISRAPSEELALAAVAAAGPARIAVVARGEATAFVIGELDLPRATARIDRVVERLAADAPLDGVGIASYAAGVERLLEPDVFVALAEDAWLQAAGGLHRIRA